VFFLACSVFFFVILWLNEVGIMGLAGLEPAAYCLGGSRSIHLSYKPNCTMKMLSNFTSTGDHSLASSDISAVRKRHIRPVFPALSKIPAR
jgi:hypothetical protein